MAKKLLAKAGLIQLPPALPRQVLLDAPSGVAVGGAVAAESVELEQAKAKTAPGSMLQFMTAQSAAVKEAELLRERLAGFDGALPARRLDPRTVGVSTWANRHADSYQDDDFAALKLDIAAAGGNVQAIKVRPLPAPAAPAAGLQLGVGPSNPLATGPDSAALLYEIVFGHRRHRACLDLGLPVLAVVEDLPEQQLFVEMERENRARKDLSAWEQGMMYARALDQGLYPSNRQLAAAIGRDLGDVGKALSLARLPLAVVQAFRSPLDLQYRWAKPLGDAQQRDPDGLVQRARAIKPLVAQRTPRQVFDALVADAGATTAMAAHPRSLGPVELTVRQGARAAAVVAVDTTGRTVVRFNKPLDETKRQALVAVLAQFLAG